MASNATNKGRSSPYDWAKRALNGDSRQKPAKAVSSGASRRGAERKAVPDQAENGWQAGDRGAEVGRDEKNADKQRCAGAGALVSQ
jgi:hypothetical protein